MQISKVETGMSDNLAAILIQAFPAAIILYVIFALALVIKTFICWASGDRRIYRHTSIECLIMIILALIVAIGGYACTVDINAKMEFGNIVNYLIGIVTGTTLVIGLDRVMKKIFVDEDWPSQEWTNDNWAEEDLED